MKQEQKRFKLYGKYNQIVRKNPTRTTALTYFYTWDVLILPSILSSPGTPHDITGMVLDRY